MQLQLDSRHSSYIKTELLGWAGKNRAWLVDNRQTMVDWAAELRSTSYGQCNSTLREVITTLENGELKVVETKFCCLGVFADRFIPGNWQDEPGQFAGVFITEGGVRLSGILLEEFLPESDYFSGLNDNWKLTFDQIATCIDFLLSL